MDAAADYHAVRQVLTQQKLPAYMSYHVRTHAGFDAIKGDDTTTLVVRTRDGKIMSGKQPKMKIGSGHNIRVADTGSQHLPFKPECYEGSSARLVTFESQAVEAIALQAICGDKKPAERSNQTDFTTLYVDPQTHRPIAAVGATSEEYVSAHLIEHFVLTGGFVVPADFSVTIAGSGPMFWLNVDAHQSYSDYRFLSALP